ncbi:aspartate/glutamate racemase family protein [Nonomuraea sp. NPDC059194]|uniref:aspartate/glutamate racemase family protein n=1 Tax=Nonomuraea sp. NPDC059194 TaxID=3346764 RepID=UPI0036797848
MEILVVNPNRVDGCTRLIHTAARAAAAPGTNVTTLAPRRGPVELTGQCEVLFSAVGVLELIAETPADAVVMAGFGEPGKEAAQELTAAPVLDITECGPLLARTLGARYTIVTSTAAAVPIVEDRLRALRLDAACAGVLASGQSVPDLVDHRQAATKAVVDTVRRAGTEVVVLGCGGMAGLAALVAAATGKIVVDGVSAAIKLAESLGALGLTHARATRPPVTGWPFDD